MDFIPQKCFADKLMLVWKYIFLGWKESNCSEQAQQMLQDDEVILHWLQTSPFL